MELGVTQYLVVSSLLFVLGVVTMLSRRNIIGMFLGVELVLNAAALNFVVFDRFVSGTAHGQVFTVFVILVAAAETAVALAIVLRVFQNLKTIQVDRISELKN